MPVADDDGQDLRHAARERDEDRFQNRGAPPFDEMPNVIEGALYCVEGGFGDLLDFREDDVQCS